jgi:hypothetical protein
MLDGLMMLAASTSERPVNDYQNTRRNIPEDSRFVFHAFTDLIN